MSVLYVVGAIIPRWKITNKSPIMYATFYIDSTIQLVYNIGTVEKACDRMSPKAIQKPSEKRDTAYHKEAAE